MTISRFRSAAVTHALWEIRSGMAPGVPGTLIASGVTQSTQTLDTATQTLWLRVDGLQIQLPAEKYWLNVPPAGMAQGESYIAATLGANAVGTPRGRQWQGL